MTLSGLPEYHRVERSDHGCAHPYWDAFHVAEDHRDGYATSIWQAEEKEKLDWVYLRTCWKQPACIFETAFIAALTL